MDFVPLCHTRHAKLDGDRRFGFADVVVLPCSDAHGEAGGDGGVHLNGTAQVGHGRDKAISSSLSHLDRTVGALLQGEAIARARRPAVTVSAVLPSGTGIDAGHIHHAVAGNSVGVVKTRVIVQADDGRSQ